MILAPSILSADFTKLGQDIMELESAGADIIHIDVMDGQFVPNISFGFPIIKAIRDISNLPFDVHLMIEEPSKFIEAFAEAGADNITIHWEADNHIDRTISLIKSFGLKASIALNPATPVSFLNEVISELDMVLIMSVNPGFGNQKFISYCYEKVKTLRTLANDKNPNLLIEVDGGISQNNIKEVVAAGADIIVAGSFVFANNNIKQNIKLLKEGFENERINNFGRKRTK